MASKLFLKRFFKSKTPIPCLYPCAPLLPSSSFLLESSIVPPLSLLEPLFSPSLISRPFFSSRPSHAEEVPGPAAVDHRSTLTEEEFHQMADETIHNLQEKLEEYGDSLQLDGFDVDYGNQVLTLKLGDLGTYVVNKQTPNRQIWLSSPVSGPSRFDWDASISAWVYRRTKSNLTKLLEEELQELCGEPIDLS
ncbi:frataxin-like protein [Carex rostrata]